ncbi:cilia- and flagella-associated protein 73 [Strigops habroptila]|uniref:Cilia and flagella associated protein 73 n=1 Tax=Strigops habroptila TaxID=2489341 RepID=A0A672UVP5_STRHB|nr:cilia- and flagella-associated protein 73 [Strigops habroptila]
MERRLERSRRLCKREPAIINCVKWGCWRSRENPRELPQPAAAPGNGVVLPPSRLPRVLRAEEAPGGMALDLEQHLSRAFRDKLRLPELHAAHGRPVPVPGGAALLPSMRLLLKRREVAEVERALQRQREEFQQRMERLAQRRQQLGQREQRLRDVVLKFNAFRKASMARQERALQRAAEAQARAAEQDAEAARLRQELAGLQQRRDRLARRLQSLQSFHSYLQAVLARMEQFQDVLSMLAHFEALLGMRAALAQEAEAGQERLAQGWARLRGYREEALSELLCIATERAQLRARLEAAHREVLQGESCWAHIQSTATEKTLLLAQIKLAVLNLFHLATAPLNIHTDVALEDTEAQLDTVLLCMQDLAAICAELHPRQPGPGPPGLPAATSVRRRGARLPPSQE